MSENTIVRFEGVDLSEPYVWAMSSGMPLFVWDALVCLESSDHL